MGIAEMTMSSAAPRLLEAAVAAVGCDDFGPKLFMEGFERHLAAIDEAGRVTLNGRRMTEAQIGLALRALLHAQKGFKQHPEVLKRPIGRPLIINGIPRSGTTALHRLISIDPQFQGTEHWITRAPMPRPPRETWASIPAYHEAKAGLDATVAAAPELRTEHMHEVDAVEESLFLLAATFVSNHYPEQWYVPSYDAWYRNADERPSYLWLADVHRLIGANDPDRRWLIKNPTDTYSIEAVLAAFPDAMIVQTHRDPVQAIPSVANLLVGVRKMYEEENCDPHALIQRDAEFWNLAMERMESGKRRDPKRYIDIDFNDFILNQMSAIHRIYEHFDIDLSPDVESRMQEWLAANPRRPGAVQRHKAEDFGMSSGELGEIFTQYRRTYGYV
jgi:hypothetical protein